MSLQRAHRIGIVGYSSEIFDRGAAARLIHDALVFRAGFHERCVVVAGYTDVGINGVAYREADKLGMGTMGIACSRAKEHPCYPVDQVRIVGSEWGEESDEFLAYIDELVKVGGGPQSEREFDAFRGPKASLDLPLWM